MWIRVPREAPSYSLAHGVSSISADDRYGRHAHLSWGASRVGAGIIDPDRLRPICCPRLVRPADSAEALILQFAPGTRFFSADWLDLTPDGRSALISVLTRDDSDLSIGAPLDRRTDLCQSIRSASTG